MFFAPTKAGKNESETLSVSVVPEIEADEPVALSVHCEFCCVALLPGRMVAAGMVPASVSSASAFDARRYVTTQVLKVDEDVPINTETEAMSAAPASSVNWAVKVWLLPVPVAGVTET